MNLRQRAPGVASGLAGLIPGPLSKGHAVDLTLLTQDTDTQRSLAFHPTRFVIAGWTGRDTAAMEHHMDELEALGIAPPASTPVFYRAATARLSHASVLQTTGDGSSGEVEYVLYNIDGTWWVGVGSDHTDRQVEAYNITVSKQMCDKPVSRHVWRYADVAAYWDDLSVACEALIDGEWVSYQSGTLSAMLPPADLVAAFEAETGTAFGPGDVMMGGTLPAIGGVRPGDAYRLELRDPRRGLTLAAEYEVETLPVAG